MRREPVEDGLEERAPLTVGTSSNEPRSGAHSRRRQIGSASARSALLTLLGEFVYPTREPVWTATLIDALGSLGVEEKAARQALTRTAAEGILASSRHGRRVLWDLTSEGHALLAEGTDRIYGFMRQRYPWDGRWLVVNVAIPETQRKLRHRLRTRLTWLGLGSPMPGLWISPDAEKADRVHEVISELDLEDRSFAWVGPASGIGDESRLITAAWELDTVQERYLEFLESFEAREAQSTLDAFVAQVEMIEEWRRFPFLDPDLPVELLDDGWPGPRAAAAFHDRHARWYRRAQQQWALFEEAGGEKPA